MKLYLTFAALLTVAACSVLGGCSVPDATAEHEEIAKEINGEMKEAAKVISSITDQESAREAVPKLEAIFQKIERLFEQGKLLPEPTAAQKARFDEIVAQGQEKLKEAMTKVQKKAIANPTIVPILMDVFQKVGMTDDQ